MKLTFHFLSILFILSILSSHLCFSQNEVTNKVKEYLDTYNQKTYPYKLYLATDKVLYESGEKIWLSALVLDRTNNLPVNTSHEIVLNLFDNNGFKILESSQTLINGTCDICIHIPKTDQNGLFKLTATLKDYPQVFFEKELQINENATPALLVELKIEDKYFGKGDKVNIQIHATDYFGAPVKNAKFQAIIRSGNKTLLTEDNRLGKDGNALVSYTLPEHLEDGLVSFIVDITDNLFNEVFTLDIPTQSTGVDLQFFPDGGQLVHGLSNLMSVKANDRYGHPFQFKGHIVNENDEILNSISSDEDGVVVIPFLPDYNKKLKLVVTEPFLVENEFSFPDVRPLGANLNVLQVEDDSVRTRIKNSIPEAQNFTLLNINNGKVYHLEDFQSEKIINFKIPKNKLKGGINQLVLFDQDGYPLSENLVYVSANKSGAIVINSDKENFNNREKADIHIMAKKGTTYSMSTADQYRLPSNLLQQNIQTFVILNSEIRGNNFLSSNNYKTILTNEQSINRTLKVTNSINNWNEIFAHNNIALNFNAIRSSNQVWKPGFQQIIPQKVDNLLVYRNYHYDIYYLASNPLLFEKLKKQEKKEESQPAYKKFLENGTPILDVIFMMKPYNLMDGKIVFQGSQNSLIAQGGALIIIDGVRVGEQASALSQISPFDVDEINISTNPSDILNYTGLNSVGIIDIKLKRGKKPEASTENLDCEFEYVDHEADKKYWRSQNDLRTTLFWQPFSRIEKGENVVPYFQSDIRGNFSIKIEGIDENGLPVYETINYNTYTYTPESQ